MDLEQLRSLSVALRDRMQQVVYGQDEAVSLIITALLAEGHVLLEGVPGTAKTLMARTFAQLIDLDFKRIQFTPDLMPGDVVGTNLFNFQTNSFALTKGPIFTQLLLADEINRTPPKTQAALLEAMQERRVTIDGTSHELGDGFMVIATQNPIEQEGTYPLPEAQLDRFLFKVTVGYPTRDHELGMVRSSMTRGPSGVVALEPIADLDAIRAARAAADTVKVADPMLQYIVDVVRATREHPALVNGASPRSANMLTRAVRVLAALQGRDYAIPDDVKALADPALSHRLVLNPAAMMDGVTTRQVIQEILQLVPAPR